MNTSWSIPIERPGEQIFRQQVLVLYLANSSLDSRVTAWAIYDGTGCESTETGDHPEPPFPTGLAAMEAGWRVLAMSPLRPAVPGMEYSTSFQKFEVILERLVEVAGESIGPKASRM